MTEPDTTTMEVSWTASNIDPADPNSYYVVDAVPADEGDDPAPVQVQESPATVDGLTAGAEYAVTVTAVSPVGSQPDPGVSESAESDPVTVTMPSLPAPTNLSAGTTDTTVSPTWTAVDGAEDYVARLTEVDGGA